MTEIKVVTQELSEAQMRDLASRIASIFRVELMRSEERLLAALKPPAPALPDLDGELDDIV